MLMKTPATLQKITAMKQKAFDFATEVVGDISRMAEAFGGGTSPGDLMAESWNDLKAMRYVYISCLVIVR